MSEDLRREMQQLKEMLTYINSRMRQLESRIAAQPTVTTPSAAERPRPALTPIPKPSVAMLPPITPPAARPKRDTLETTIGRYWLNRIGIISLVIGIALFILYSFQYLGAVAKIGIGFSIGLGLIWTGVRMEHKAGLAWYARSLLGGGWAITYFTTFAMYHLPGVQLVHSAVVDLCLLLAVAAGAIWHALKYRSQALVALAFLLGFFTTALSHVTPFTFASTVLLAGSLGWVVVRMRWHDLALFGVVGTYLTHLGWIVHQLVTYRMTGGGMSGAAAPFWLSIAFLTLYWITYNIVILALDERTAQARKSVLSATLVNAGFFIQQMLSQMNAHDAAHKYLALLVIAAVYGVLSIVAQRRGLLAVSRVQVLLALSLATFAIPLKFSDRWVSVTWMGEVGLLTTLGLRYRQPSYRAFAMVLAIVMVMRLLLIDFGDPQRIPFFAWLIRWRLLVGLYGVAVLTSAAACYRAPSLRDAQRPWERQAFHFYGMAAGWLGWMVTQMEFHGALLVFLLALEAAGAMVIGWILRDRALRMLGTLGFTIGAMQLSGIWQGAMSDGSLLATLTWIGLLYVTSWRYQVLPEGPTFTFERKFGPAYGFCAVLLLTIYLGLEVGRAWVSPAFAVEGLALVAAGFGLRDKTLRVSGLCVFGLLVLKILFHDLAGAETIYRILSFVAAGALLLIASFVYAKYTGHTPKSDE